MTDLLPHQIEDAKIMASSGHALNYSGMGTGKTLTALHAFVGQGYERGLILAPPIALDMWAQNVTDFTGMSSQILRTGKQKIKGEPAFIICTYALATGGQYEQLDEYFYNNKRQVMILDEAHYLKSRDAKRTKGVFGPACNGKNGLFDLFDCTWSMTGTPITRYYDDLWAQLRATKPEVLRAYGVETYEKFLLTFCHCQLKQYHKRQRPQRVVVGNKNHELMARMIKDCNAIKRTLREVASSMPPVTYREISVNNAHTSALARELKNVEIDEKDENVIANWRELGLARLPEVASYAMECMNSGPVLFGHWFRDTGSALYNTLRESGYKVAQVNGSTAPSTRELIRYDFNEGKLDGLVGQISAMNTAWNIQEAAAHVVMIEDNWSPALVDQFIGRVYRMGQKNHVQVDFIKSDHPVDEALTDSRKRKAQGIERAAL